MPVPWKVPSSSADRGFEEGGSQAEGHGGRAVKQRALTSIQLDTGHSHRPEGDGHPRVPVSQVHQAMCPYSIFRALIFETSALNLVWLGPYPEERELLGSQPLLPTAH